MDHGAYLPLDRGQQVTILASPFWVWRDLDMLAGTYMVPVTNFTSHRANPTPSIPTGDDHSPTTSPPGAAPSTDMALLGLVPLACFLHEADENVRQSLLISNHTATRLVVPHLHDRTALTCIA